MVFFPAVQAVLNAEPRQDPRPPSILQTGASSSNDDHPSAPPPQAQAGPGPSTSSNSARFAPVQVGGRMAPPQAPQGAIRKQNIACDACRSRKIRCQRISIYQIVSSHTSHTCSWIDSPGVSGPAGRCREYSTEEVEGLYTDFER